MKKLIDHAHDTRRGRASSRRCRWPGQPSRAPRLRWTPCHAEADPRLECATFRVPLDHDRRSGPTIELAVIRLPASDPARRIGSLFLNPGGPGTSGVGMVLDAATDGADILHRRGDRPLRPRRV